MWDLVHAAPNLQVPVMKWPHTGRKEAMMMGGVGEQLQAGFVLFGLVTAN
jgi:hypothetical protein